MKKHSLVTLLIVLAGATSAVIVGQQIPRPVTAGAVPSYAPERTPWGDPDIQGSFTNSDESLIPMERPDSLAGRTVDSITAQELQSLIEARNQQRVEADKQRWELRSPLHWFENHNPKNSRAWLVVDPPDGKIPPVTAEAAARAKSAASARRAAASAGEVGPASWEDMSMYDRCISRGLPSSMLPAIYGNSYRIVQGPGYVAIGYEMVNEMRVIPLDGRPHAPSTLRSYMGDARGRFEGNTLVVETTNFNGRVPFRGSSEKLRVVERFTPIAPGVLEWAVTLDDPATWTRSWTFAMNLTHTDEEPFEYACHEGNYAMRNILEMARKADGK